MKEPFSGSFQEAVDFEYNFRKRNPALAQQNGWTLDVGEIEQYVDQYNAARMISGGWLDFVDSDPLPQPEVFGFTQKKTLFASVVDRSRALKAAVGTFRDMFGDKGVVAKDLAEKRAAICVKCPANDLKRSLYSWFVTSTAAEIEKVYEMMNGISLTTSNDSNLGVCKACQCPMRVKVHVRLDHIKSNMPEDVPSKLNEANPYCWVMNEV